MGRSVRGEAVVGFVVGYMLFVPLTCTATTAIPGVMARPSVRASSAPGYRSVGVSEPPTDLARLAGTIAAVVGAVVTLGGLIFFERGRRS